MNREDGKRQQAQDLLRALTDIDDRFLEEAMSGVQETDTSFEYDPDRVKVKLPRMQEDPAVSMAAAAKADDQTVDRVNEPEASTSDKVTDISEGRKKKPSGMLRRYSSWALTAAACLTVIVVGRYVSVSSVKTDMNTTAIESEYRADADSKAAEDSSHPAIDEAAENSAKEESVPASDEAAGNSAKEESAPASDEAAGDSAKEESAPASDEAAGDSAKEESAPASDEAAENFAQDMDSAQEVSSQAAGSASEDSAQEVSSQAAGGASEDSAQEADSAQEEAAPSAAIGLSGNNALGLANPFVDVETLEEAEKEAGFEISLPKAEAPYDKIVYRAMPGEMIEVIYLDKNDKEGYRIRKAVDTNEDISGDSTKYVKEDTLKAKDGTLVQAAGSKDGEWSRICWSFKGEDKKEYTCAVLAGAKTFTSEEILNIVSTINESK